MLQGCRDTVAPEVGMGVEIGGSAVLSPLWGKRDLVCTSSSQSFEIVHTSEQRGLSVESEQSRRRNLQR